MNITLPAAVFADAVSTVSRALSAKPTMPVLEGILLMAEESKLTVSATDLSLGIEQEVSAEVKKPGAVALQGRLLLELARKLPPGDVTISVVDKTAKVVCHDSRFTLAVLSAEEFPRMPQEKTAAPLEFSCSSLKGFINKVIFSVSSEESRPGLSGCLFEKKDGTLTMVALDISRMAMVEEDREGADFSAIIPGRALGEIVKILPDEGTVSVCFSEAHGYFKTDSTQIQTRLLSGDFTRYRALIPAGYKTRVELPAALFRDCLERVSVLSRETANHMALISFVENKMSMSSKSQSGDAHEELLINFSGEPLDICFNAKLLLEMLRVIGNQSIVLTFTSPLAPCTVAAADRDTWLYLLMPMRMPESIG